jgi:hypothetical protein
MEQQKHETNTTNNPETTKHETNPKPIKPINNNDLVIGLFWATAVTEQHIFIEKSDIPYPLPAANQNTLPCTTVPYSSTIKPKLWQ